MTLDVTLIQALGSQVYNSLFMHLRILKGLGAEILELRIYRGLTSIHE